MSSINAYAKVNIFLKITGMRGNYHELLSRFVRVDSLHDTITLVTNPHNTFSLQGDFNCTLEQNTIYKAYHVLLDYLDNPQPLIDFYAVHAVAVTKRIPSFAGLGGGSSDAAAFLQMSNRELSLNIPTDTLAQIGAKVGADVPFFIYGYPSANVSGIGEIVEPFDEENLDFELVTPGIACDTPAVYRLFREKFYHTLSPHEQTKMKLMPSRLIMEQYNAKTANDLYQPALQLCETLADAAPEGYFFSGSGSSFFKLR